MIAAIYARKSTQQNGHADEAKSVARQIDGARLFIRSKGWTLDNAHVYTDDGVSGALFANRAEFQRMMRDAEAGAFDAIVLFDLDRFGRDSRKTMTFLHQLADLEVEVWDYSRDQRVDLDSFEGETLTFLNTRFAQQFREQIRKHTRDALRRKAEQGFVTGGKVFGYQNVRIAKGQVERRILDHEAGVVREIHQSFADGHGLRTIAGALNARGVAAPRAQQGRVSGWSASTVRSVLGRAIYRGVIEYGATQKAYGRELRRRGSTREKGQIPAPPERLIRIEAPQLRIIDPELAARVDARRQDWAARTTPGRQPQKAAGAYLLSGGMLLCPTCGGHFEAFKSPWNGEGVYRCATARRKPGTCTNMMRLPIPETDDLVLSTIEGEVLGRPAIDALLAYVETTPDVTAQLAADRERIQTEITRLVESIAAGVPASAVAPQIRERESELARLDVQLRKPRPAQTDSASLRDALEQRTADWRARLRTHPREARMLVRRLVGPLTLHDERPEWVPETDATLYWQAPTKPAELLRDLTNCPS